MSATAREIVSTPDAPAAIGPYSQAVRHGGLLFCSGALPLVPESGELDDASPASETARCLRNLEAICRAQGTTLAQAVKLTVYTTTLDQFSEINAAYAEFFPTDPPARVTIGVAALPKGARVEIDAIVPVG